MTETATIPAVTLPEEWAWLASLCDPQALFTVTNAKMNPWQIGDRVVATDGHILVAVRGGFAPEPDAQTTKSIEGVLKLPKAEPVPLDWPALRAFIGPASTITCPECGGKGKIGEDCEECDGTGTQSCSCRCGDEHEKECEECDGEGGKRCPTCHGKKYQPEPVALGSAAFDRKLLARAVSRLDAPAVRFAQDGPERPAYFIADEWTIVAMPMRYDERDTLPRFDIVSELSDLRAANEGQK